MLARLNLVLLFVTVATALYLVHVQFRVRSLFIERDQSIRTWNTLKDQQNQLEVKVRELSSSSRVENIATNQLQMRHIYPSTTLYIKNGKVISMVPTVTSEVAGAQRNEITGEKGH